MTPEADRHDNSNDDERARLEELVAGYLDRLNGGEERATRRPRRQATREARRSFPPGQSVSLAEAS